MADSHKFVELDYTNYRGVRSRLAEGRIPPARLCAGLAAVLLREKMPNQMMRIAMRLGILDPDKIDPKNEAYRSWDDVVKAHSGEEPEA